MKVISLSGNSKLHLKRTCIAIGIFDGLHLGHQYLIQKMMAASRRLGAQPVVITFFPHPAHILRPDLKLGYLTSLTERLRRLNDLGVATCLVVRFNRSFAGIEPQKFIKDILVKKLGVQAVFVGANFRFGKDRGGDAALFRELAPVYGYEMHAVAGLKKDGAVISSSRVRQLVEAGKLSGAKSLLGRGFSVSGVVVKGARRGRSLGFPTANVAYEADILPPKGVYIVKAILGKKEYPAMANIGTRPSFEKQIIKLHLEVHILDFSRDIYGKHLEVVFLKKLRNEKKFTNPQALIRQIRKDESLARKYFY
jgi:riboflavin kinase/FMN adenylyltransferase